MNLLRLQPRTWTTGLLALLLAAGSFVTLQGCTDLGEETFGVITPDQFFQTEDEIFAALAPVYAQLRASLWAYHNLSQISSDENIVPTRGSDWFDGGRWLQIHRHTWNPGLVDLNDAWVASYTGVARANGLLQQLETADVPNKAAVEAEIRALRAFYYYQVMDLFGNVPVVGDEAGEFLVDSENPQGTETRAFVFDFIESELQAARGALPATRDAGQFGRLTQGAVDALLASMYLNAEVFTAQTTAGGLSGGQARWQDAYDTASRVINSGNYSLEEDWFRNFATDNENSPEHLFLVQHLAEDGLGVNFQMRALHYNQTDPNAWNGFSTLAEVYNSFEEEDPRRNIFLIGQAISYETGEPVQNRQGEPLVFTPIIGDATSATEGEGIRILKFPYDQNNVGGNHGNDYAFYRLAEMYLIRAEAANALGRPDEAIGDLNIIRQRVGLEPLAGGQDQGTVRELIKMERLRELTYEAKRRQDLVRFGEFTSRDWEFKETNDPFRVVFPIPQTQLDSNPNLSQNPGY